MRKLLRVPLTTVDWDLNDMGRQAARLLTEMIEGSQQKNDRRRNVNVKPGLVVRNSCGAVVNEPVARLSHRKTVLDY